MQHDLKNAEGIQDLITAGSAKFAAEARCPRTLFSYLSLSQEPAMELDFDVSMTRAPVFVVPGVIATADCELPTRDASVIWRKVGTTVAAKQGTWLVRGRAVKEDLSNSLLLIEIVEWLDDHEMSISPYPDQDGNTRLRISIPAVQEPRLADEAFIAQAWQAAMAYLAGCDAFNYESDSDANNIYATELQAKLSGLALWLEPSWDPLRAATRLLGMPPPARERE